MIILPTGPFIPVTPVKPVTPVTPRKARGVDKTEAEKFAGTRAARSATDMTSEATRAALEEIKLGG